MNSDETEMLLSLMQMADSASPIGGFSHSWGMETWVQRGQLADAKSVEEALTNLLDALIIPLDGSACAIAHECAAYGDEEQFVELNECLTASKWNEEILKASTAMGQRLYQLASAAQWIQQKPLPAGLSVHHSCTFGWIAGQCGIERKSATAAYLLQSLASLVSACVRLVPLGHTAGQLILTRLRRNIPGKLTTCLNATISDVGGFAPLHEWACQQHLSLYSRLFQS